MSLIFILLNKRSYKNFIVIAVISALLITAVLCSDISFAKDYYGVSNANENEVTGTVSFCIRCDTIIGKDGAPDSPVILNIPELEIHEGDTVYTALVNSTKVNNVPFEHNGSYYISGIDNLYEFQFGELSGWMYRVNGQTPSVGCNEYVLKDNDKVEWLYTCDIGNDLN